MSCFCPIFWPEPVAPVNLARATAGNHSWTVTSNSVRTDLVRLGVQVTACPLSAARGDRVHITVTVRNESTVPLTDVTVRLPEAWPYLEAVRVCYGGVPIPRGDLRTGITIPGMGAGASCVLCIDGCVGKGAPAELVVTAEAFTHYNTPTGWLTVSATSNPVTIAVTGRVLALHKSASVTALTPDAPVVTFTLTATNYTGETLEDVVLTDALPPGLVYVPGSTVVGGGTPVDANPAGGISVGTLAPGESVTVRFGARAFG